jgi:transposase
MSSSVALAPAAAVVAVDVGKAKAAVLVSDAQRHRLLGPLDFPMTAAGLAEVIGKTRAVLPADGLIRVGVEAAGHYHRPLASSSVWPGWQVVELNPAHVSEQRRVMGRRRVKTDALDLEAITELVLAGRGVVVAETSAPITELRAWAGLRRRRVATRVATKNQLLSQLDRCFPGLTLALPNVLDARVGCLVAQEFADPRRLARLGVSRFIRFAAARGLQVRRPVAERLISAAREALPSVEAPAARHILAADFSLLASLEEQVRTAEAAMAKLLPDTAFATLLTVPDWAVVRVGNYAAAVGDLDRWPSASQLYRAAGLSPIQYESAGRRRDSSISREGSVALRRALLDLGMGLWHGDPAAKRYAEQLRARGKHGGVIACAMAHRANKIAYALARDQAGYDPARWA